MSRRRCGTIVVVVVVARCCGWLVVVGLLRVDAATHIGGQFLATRSAVGARHALLTAGDASRRGHALSGGARERAGRRRRVGVGDAATNLVGQQLATGGARGGGDPLLGLGAIIGGGADAIDAAKLARGDDRRRSGHAGVGDAKELGSGVEVDVEVARVDIAVVLLGVGRGLGGPRRERQKRREVGNLVVMRVPELDFVIARIGPRTRTKQSLPHVPGRVDAVTVGPRGLGRGEHVDVELLVGVDAAPRARAAAFNVEPDGVRLHVVGVDEVLHTRHLTRRRGTRGAAHARKDVKSDMRHAGSAQIVVRGDRVRIHAAVHAEPGANQKIFVAVAYETVRHGA